MATDVLILGPVVFQGFQVPERMPYGGKQQLQKHQYPGGMRDVDAMGPDDDDRKWSGILWGDDAFDTMLLLDSLRVAGEELPLSWGAESRTVVIADFSAQVEKVTCIHYSITCMFTDDSGSGSGPLQTLTSLVASDLASAVGL